MVTYTFWEEKLWEENLSFMKDPNPCCVGTCVDLQMLGVIDGPCCGGCSSGECKYFFQEDGSQPNFVYKGADKVHTVYVKVCCACHNELTMLARKRQRMGGGVSAVELSKGIPDWAWLFLEGESNDRR